MDVVQDARTPIPRHFLIDALNLAYWCGSPPSLRIPLSVFSALRACGHSARLIFDASARYQLEAEAEIYTALLKFPDCAAEVPAGQPADRELIKQARASGATIISRDKFRDYRKKFRKLIDDPERVISGFVEDDRILLPAIGLVARLAPSASEIGHVFPGHRSSASN